MAERKGAGLGAVSFGLIALAAVVGFGLALLSARGGGILPRFVVPWGWMSSLAYLAGWAPGILLVSAAIAMEGSGSTEGFAGAAGRNLAPALALAALMSIFYLLVVPGVEARRSWYESGSALFKESMAEAEAAIRDGDLEEAGRRVAVCGAIDPKDSRFVATFDRLQAALIKMAAAVGGAETGSAPATAGESATAANRFYLEALRAREEGRVFDAHYLAKRSAALYAYRPEVRRLVEETWRDVVSSGPSPEEGAAAAFYARKLAGYRYFQEGDYLEAFRIYAELSADHPDDADVKNYLAKSEEGLLQVAFYLQDDAKAFGRSDERGFDLAVETEDGTARLAAERVSVGVDGLYFRDATYERSGPDPVKILVPNARLSGDVLIVRAVDRDKPDIVRLPVYAEGGPGGTGPYAVRTPFTEDQATRYLGLKDAPEDIQLSLLVGGLDDAARFGIDARPLKVELAGRIAYPFIAFMLVLLGAGFGMRFKPAEPTGLLTVLLTAPLLVALSLPPLSLVADFGRVAALAIAAWVPGSLFLAAWIGFLSVCIVACLFLSARIARHAPS